MSMFGGLARSFAVEELARGAVGTMIGTVCPAGLGDAATIRPPGPSIGAETENELDKLLGSLDLERV